jgi:hypothetical protein
MNGEIDNPAADERFDPKHVDREPEIEVAATVIVKFRVKVLRDPTRDGVYLSPDDYDFCHQVCDDKAIEKAIEVLQEGRGGYKVEYDS